MRILVNFQHNERWIISSLAEDCQTIIGPNLDVASLDTLRRLLLHAGVDTEEMEHFEYCVRTWGRGSIWVNNLTDGGAKLLKIRVPENGQISLR